MIPAFKAGEIHRVMDYVKSVLPQVGIQLGLEGKQLSEFQDLVLASMAVNGNRMNDCLNAPYVEAVPESRALLDFLEPILVGEESEIRGEDNLECALAFMKRGGNVLLVQNHTSGADTIVTDYLVNRAYGNAAKEWIWMAGHVVNLFLLPLIMCGGLHRVQIFSSKYSAQADEAMRRNMKEQNAKALGSIASMIMGGGKLIGLYPEGGRGEGALKLADPKTMKIPQLMAMASVGLMVLPTYVSGATSILPVVRGENEFNEFLHYIRRGNATVEFGPGIMWDDLQPGRAELDLFLAEKCCKGTTPDQALKQHLLERVMKMVAAMAPTKEAKGPYAS